MEKEIRIESIPPCTYGEFVSADDMGAIHLAGDWYEIAALRIHEPQCEYCKQLRKTITGANPEKRK